MNDGSNIAVKTTLPEGWEVYDPAPRYVTLRKYGAGSRVVFSEGAARDLGLEDRSYVTAFWNKAEHSLGLRFNDIPSANQWKVRPITTNMTTSQCVISMTTFMKDNGIDAAKHHGQHLPYERVSLRSVGIDEDGEMVVIHLGTKSPEVA